MLDIHSNIKSQNVQKWIDLVAKELNLKYYTFVN